LGRERGFYCKFKISNPIHPRPKRIYNKRLNKAFDFHKIQLRTFIINELLKSGDGFSEKNFEISNGVSNFLKEKYALKRQWVDGSEFLNLLEIPLKIRKVPDSLPIMVDEFEIKFGNARRKKYFSGEDVNDKKGKIKFSKYFLLIFQVLSLFSPDGIFFVFIYYFSLVVCTDKNGVLELQIC
jgi:hypothetical protein